MLLTKLVRSHIRPSRGGTRPFCRKTLLPDGQFADGHSVERTVLGTDNFTNGLFPNKTFFRKDNLPKLEKWLGLYVTHFSTVQCSTIVYRINISSAIRSQTRQWG